MILSATHFVVGVVDVDVVDVVAALAVGQPVNQTVVRRL